ncbi:MAG: hypothetical protein ACRDNG_08105, partial [Gaiellaceae bacterium]
LRGGGEAEPAAEIETRPATTQPESAEPTFVEAAAELREASVPAGVLTYADELCRVRSVTLPDLDVHPGAVARACRFRSTVGNEVAFGGKPREPQGSLIVRCGGGAVELRMRGGGGLFARAPGRCAIAWHPAGLPTFLHRGEVMRFAPCPGDEPETLPLRCTRTLLAQDDLEREFRQARWTRFDFRVEELHWLDNRRFAAIVRAQSADEIADVLAVFENRQLVADPRYAYNDLDTIRPSPSGALVSARIPGPGGIITVDRDGEPVRLALRHGGAVTWSPDEEWIAEATADGIYIFRADDDSPQFIQIPIVALDLVWR